jgi:hypothetical protein
MKSQEIKELVEKETGLDLKTRTRETSYLIARGLFFSLCRKNTIETFDQLSKYYSGDHATVVHSVSKFYDTYSKEKNVMRTFEKLDKIINGIEDVINPNAYSISPELVTMLVDEIKHLDECDVIDLIKFRIKPYCLMIKNNKNESRN